MQEAQALKGRRILLGITGGVAAYKTPDLVRRFRDREAEVRVVLSRAASQFVTEGALIAVGAAVVSGDQGGMVHIDLARWADVVLVAPATAHFLSRLAAGACDDLLTTICLATHAPIAVAPAMNQAMWRNPATQENQTRLRARAIHFIGPADGLQACGDRGPGRMAEIGDLIATVERLGGQQGALRSIVAVVTAGPTYEPLDPVRGFTNRSSGKMGYALAEALAGHGAQVTLVSGPTRLETPARVRKIAVTTALQMRDAVASCREGMHLFIAAAAVADYRPETVLAQKLKKRAESFDVRFVRNPDILAEVASWRPAPFTVGFAAETENLEAHGREKLIKKGLNLVVANPVGDPDAGFEADTNRVILIDKDTAVAWAPASKVEIAQRLVLEITPHLTKD